MSLQVVQGWLSRSMKPVENGHWAPGEPTKTCNIITMVHMVNIESFGLPLGTSKSNQHLWLSFNMFQPILRNQ